ncbi:hypothetical protein IMZ11_38940 [Microtetraspora sp. AC03309]|uniref:hypothetical protein n=1 Tax=Microtetraspora sp. AC03309 TaxID=2779376 RepID=UPI001E5A418B|nr:hypothetical protein [Microtetraspora sp. AC03309]MCC5581596.1 hypothetical protein [Microtetraspora sp. AC03309]
MVQNRRWTVVAPAGLAVPPVGAVSLVVLQPGAGTLMTGALTGLASMSCMAVQRIAHARERRSSLQLTEKRERTRERSRRRKDSEIQRSLARGNTRLDTMSADPKRTRDLISMSGARLRDLPRMDRRITASSEATENSYYQLESFVDIRTLLDSGVPLPPLRDWAASPDMPRSAIGEIRDDAGRAEERAAGDRRPDDFPELARTHVRAEKGADLLRRAG